MFFFKKPTPHYWVLWENKKVLKNSYFAEGGTN